MADSTFDLSLALDCSFDSESMEFEDSIDCCSSGMSGPCCDLHDGIDIEISQNPQSMRSVVNLIIALQRMKHTHTLQGAEFSDDQLYNIIMENMVEECMVIGAQKSAADTYMNLDRHKHLFECSFRDELQRSMVLNESAPELQAVTLKGGSQRRSVRLNLTSYNSLNPNDNNGQAVCLGVAQRNLYLSCSEKSGIPTLCLEMIHEKDMLKSIDPNTELARFLFLWRNTGHSLNTFESVRFRGWFISTAESENESEPVEMCTKSDSSHLMAFKLNERTKLPQD